MLGLEDFYELIQIDSDLIRNGDFSAGGQYWKLWQNMQFNLNQEQMQIYFANGTGIGGSFYQPIGDYSIGSGAGFEVRIDIENTGSINKPFTLWMQPNGATEVVSCSFVILRNRGMKTYIMRFDTSVAWQQMLLVMKPNLADNQGVMVDNISVRQIPSINSTETECMQPLPANNNLVKNGDFSAGIQYWKVWKNMQHTLTQAQMQIYFANGTGIGGSFYQYLGNYLIPSGSGFEVLIDINNTGTINKPFTMWLQPDGGAEVISCSYVVRRNQGMDTFIMRFQPSIDWEHLMLVMKPNLADNQGVIVDNISVRHLPSLNGTVTQCIAPIPEDSNLVWREA